MLGKIIYNEQEQSGDYKWLGIASYMTANFKSTFGDYAEIIATIAVKMILEKHPNDADYFQTFCYEYRRNNEHLFMGKLENGHVLSVMFIKCGVERCIAL